MLENNIFLPVFLIVLGTSIWVYFDANSIGVRKGQLKGVCDMEPGGWAFVCLLVWIVGFPVYLAKRAELKRINGKGGAPVAPPLAAAPPAMDFDEQLRKWAKLKQEGVISEDEFNQKKKALLGI